ncbi:DHS-like NAD/FAD-binding domain-containing protein [Phlegmacium glaucopus]|nr:DHS-like NAD/FAD-binding domain-containing protein [Phlegmacium glaucopus]
MTVFLPLDPSSPLPPLPSFLVPPANSGNHLARVIQAIMKAKRIVVICGAGISVKAGIPDFRSSDGLFKTIKRDNPRETMSSGKELFDASVFNAEHTTSLFCQMIAQLSDLSQAAQPTSFHNLLRALDIRGKLLRVYTQNIDAIEQKSGLSFGVPEFEAKRNKSRSKPKSNDTDPVPSISRFLSPPVETPRCIPLHGTLQTMHCQIYNHSFPLLEYLPSLISGQPPSCPECTSLETTRQLVGKRPRGIGKLRPNVVLYNEAHKDAEGVGQVVQKDLIGSSKGKGRNGADLLLVVGTSLRVPGTKRMVREFAKAVRARGPSSPSTKDESSGLATPAPSPRRSPTADEEPIPKAVYLNLDFPVPTREWEGVFDAWIQGDAQLFSDMLRAEIEKEAKAKEMKEMTAERKRRRDLEVAALADDELPDLTCTQQEKTKNITKRKLDGSLESPVKRCKASRLMSPPNTPPSIQRSNHQEPPGDSQPKDKFYLRIPPSRPSLSLKPEVYITLRPSSRPYSASVPSLESDTSSSADATNSQPNKRTKAGRRVVRQAREAKRTEIKALQ